MGPYVPSRFPGAPRVELIYRRLPDRVRTYRQELLLDGPDCKITLLLRPRASEALQVAEGVTLGGGASLLWFTFPGRWHEVAAFHDRHGRLLGHYTNIVRPPRTDGRRWELVDLFLDIWQPRDGPPRVLDEDEFQQARASGWLEEEAAERARGECDRLAKRARAGDWPPSEVTRHPLESVPFLRLRRDSPGTYHASLLSGRVVGYGLYVLGAVSVTSVIFAAFTDAFVTSGRSQTIWLAAVAGGAAALLPLSLLGKLPATRWPRPAPADERTLFIAALAAGLAVLLLDGEDGLRAPLAAVYGVLFVFLTIFAACRAWFDRTVPLIALGGLAVSAFALLLLLLR